MKLISSIVANCQKKLIKTRLIKNKMIIVHSSSTKQSWFLSDASYRFLSSTSCTLVYVIYNVKYCAEIVISYAPNYFFFIFLPLLLLNKLLTRKLSHKTKFILIKLFSFLLQSKQKRKQ